MAVEGDDDGRSLGIPQADGTVGVSDSVDVGVELALRNDGNLMFILGIVPARKELALFDVPGENLLVGRDYGAAGGGGARGRRWFGRPNSIGGTRGDDTKCFKMLPTAVELISSGRTRRASNFNLQIGLDHGEM